MIENKHFKWSHLSRMQLGKYGEYFTKMEFTKAGLDVYTAEVDNKGIDFVVRKNENEYFDIQAKSVRNYNYIFVRKDFFQPRKNLLLVVALFKNTEQPTILLIPSLDWIEQKHKFLTSRDYNNLKSRPEWGVNIKVGDLQEFIDHYSFDRQVENL